MSWFTEIAGKAEDLLNKVDQTAATALQKQTKTHSYSQGNLYDPSRDSSPSATALAYSPSRRIPTSPTRPFLATKARVSSSTIPGKKPESDDEKLLRYLNEAPPPLENRPRMRESVSEVAADVPTSFTEEIVSTTTEAIEQKSHQAPKVEETPSDITIDQVAKDEELQKPPMDTPDRVPSRETLPESNAADGQDLVQAQKRAQHAEAEMKRMARKLDHWNSQISGSDRVCRELRERERDLAAAMDAKDSQLAILKVRLQEADQELLLKESLARELREENERLIREHAESASLQNGTLGALQDQLQQVEAELSKAKDALQQSQNEHMHQRSKMEEEHRHLVDSYSSLQKKWNDMNERNKELVSQLRSASGNFDTLQQEYNDYKQKAQRILQSKEKLISSLKEGNYDLESLESSSSPSSPAEVEADAVRAERDLLREELRRATERSSALRSEIRELEQASQGELASAEQRSRLLREQLEMERVLREELQGAGSQLKEEVQLLKEDLTRTKTTFQSRLQDREIEIEKLRRQLTAKSLSTVSQEELESRLHALTENLIQKQTVVEALSTEKNSLVLQLERMEQQLREAQNYGFHQHTYVGMNNNESDRKSKAVFLENPFDSALTRRVKRVYGSIDSLSIRLGVFFRRYPISRVFVFVYMLLLHFWVMVVLLTYEPEIHHSAPGNVDRR